MNLKLSLDLQRSTTSQQSEAMIYKPLAHILAVAHVLPTGGIITNYQEANGD